MYIRHMETITKYEISAYEGQVIVDLFTTSNKSAAAARANNHADLNRDVFIAYYNETGAECASSPQRFHTAGRA
jgi:hypothetical protein